MADRTPRERTMKPSSVPAVRTLSPEGVFARPLKRRCLTTLIYERAPCVWNDSSMTQCDTSESTDPAG